MLHVDKELSSSLMVMDMCMTARVLKEREREKYSSDKR